MHQRGSAELLTPRQIQNENMLDLTFSIFPSDRAFVVYRPHVMQFLMENIMDSDFMVYTMAMSDNAFFHVRMCMQ